MLNPSDPVDLTVQLMSIDSTSGHEGEVIAWLDTYLAARGWRTQRIPVSAGRDDLFATAVDAPLVTLSTHLDTVPPFIPPRIDGDRILGRGACDAKGIAAAMICAAERLRMRNLPVALLFVVGEEVTHDGAHAANEAFAARVVPATSRALIDGEPTESTLALGTKGAVRVTVRTAGQAAHSAYPHLGRSATRDLVRLLAELDAIAFPRDELLGETTVNIGSLSGGVADNVVAPWAEARIMIRLVSPAAEVMSILERWADGRATLEWGPMVPPVKLGAAAGFETSIAAFATDIPVLTNWGTPYLFGPGSIHVAHRDDEFVEIGELRRAVETYERLVEGLVG
ncbi:MAG TPA: M20/M25/M40 family metallo-hydrolase [Gemmatimonadaceae bacterium]|nr:M20/M25/M40 family metallo-hydrolase [Gemmatimonadaceae bacterium]